jgi:DNA-binding MarR family transcriptional regulator
VADNEMHALSKQEKRLGILLWFRLSRFYNQSIRETNQHLKKWEITAAQFDVLAQVGTAGRISQQDLADKLVVTKGNIAQIIQKVEELGWITREQDWKTKYVSLTAEGKALFDDVVPMQEQFQAAQFNNLNPSEQKQLLDLLKKLKS